MYNFWLSKNLNHPSVSCGDWFQGPHEHQSHRCSRPSYKKTWPPHHEVPKVDCKVFHPWSVDSADAKLSGKEDQLYIEKSYPLLPFVLLLPYILQLHMLQTSQIMVPSAPHNQDYSVHLLTCLPFQVFVNPSWSSMLPCSIIILTRTFCTNLL